MKVRKWYTSQAEISWYFAIGGGKFLCDCYITGKQDRIFMKFPDNLDMIHGTIATTQKCSRSLSEYRDRFKLLEPGVLDVYALGMLLVILRIMLTAFYGRQCNLSLGVTWDSNFDVKIQLSVWKNAMSLYNWNLEDCSGRNFPCYFLLDKKSPSFLFQKN